ncbi:hypothetical protein [Streptomyces sp. DSM 40750]|uniref:hypothetical protein n=1 Tax=Streptomyces sp. DSM 40750 TaxID=2801030 RepID=UPI00214C2E18|nr:hypothetical protein [Streptomyces sp. DSM 40750]UUU23041.1 hypothetical protein JIX55_23635 [Streptomyces sp. DSM 40750]
MDESDGLDELDEWEYRALLAVDIESSAGRGDPALLRIREALSTALRESFERSGIDWEKCLRHDLGDGMQVTTPARLRKTRLIHPLIHELTARLRAHNSLAAPRAQVRVRIALHAGEVHIGSGGQAVGRPLEVLARLLNASPARTALRQAPDAVAALLISPHFYDETVCHGHPGIDPAAFREVTFTEKEYTASAWLHLPEHQAPASGPEEPPQPSELVEPSEPEEPPQVVKPPQAEEPAQPAPADERPLGHAKMINKASGNGVVYALQSGTQTINHHPGT